MALRFGGDMIFGAARRRAFPSGRPEPGPATSGEHVPALGAMIFGGSQSRLSSALRAMSSAVNHDDVPMG